MREKLFDKNEYIQLEPISHTYRNNTGRKYQSITTRLGELKEPFDAENIAKFTAKGRLGKNASDTHVNILAEQLKGEWKTKNKQSQEYGTAIHLFMETGQFDLDFLQTINLGITESKLKDLSINAKYIFSQYAKQYEEEILWDDETGKAGCVDKVCLRTARGNVVDIFDYKTNIEKGIYFDSIKKEDGLWLKHYNRYYLEPFETVEQCNYFDYCLQLSTYGLMAERLGYKVGKLQIMFIDLNCNLIPIPVPYMRKEAEMVLGPRIEVKEIKISNIVSIDTEEDW